MDDDTPLFKICPVPNKGYGLLATRPITPGTTILTEGQVARVPHPANNCTEEHLSAAFSNCTQAEKDQVLALHEGDAPDCSQLMRIFKANTFGDQEACWLHPLICRINHSCIANATIDRDPDSELEALVVADKYIAEGEEICFSYNHELYEITTAAQRAVLLKRQYGFACVCTACEVGTEFQRLSDMRRLMMKDLRSDLYGLTTSDFSLLDKTEPKTDAISWMAEENFWVKEMSSVQDLPPAERAAKFVLLAKLREAEGAAALPIAQSYWRAAEGMFEQVVEMDKKNLVVLPWAKSVRDLMQKAVEVLDGVRSPFDDDSQKLRMAWKNMEGKPCMKVALGFIDGVLNMPVKRRKATVGNPYAIHFTPSKQLRILSREEFEALAYQGIEPAAKASEKPPQKVSTSSWHGRIRQEFSEVRGVYKILGAALTCAAPVAAYWMMR